MNELVSVIMPVYNHAKMLRRSLDSLRRQTYSPIEIIIVNDGSTDNFKDVIDSILQDKKFGACNIFVVEQENKGAPAARNRGYAFSKGEYVIFFDADTIADKDLIKKMKLALDKNPAVSYVYSGFKYGWKIMKPMIFDAAKLKSNNYIDVTALIRRNDFPGFDETINRFQDWDMWLTMLEKNKTGLCLPELLYKKIVAGRSGISRWMPKFAFRLRWKSKEVLRFEESRSVVRKKHGLEP
ncbi:MAG: glycosyltransferase family A protein [Candidatus Magasanikbacteria bacterium]|nr:glycosyltransferase family A protein [Candidatus Magasanikbacteria bacterium]